MAKKKKKPGQPSSDVHDLPLPDRRIMEQMMRQIGGMIEGGPHGPQAETPLDRAQEVIYKALEVSGAEQVRLAREALKISPDCADAYVLLAENQPTPEATIPFYEQGVAAGQRALGEEAFQEDVGHFWGILETRPYMRAREGLAQCLWSIGRLEDAVGHYQEILRLNPNDNQGVRYSLLTLLLDLDRDAEADRLMAAYDEETAHWAYSRVLLTFRKEGDSPRAAKLLKQASKANQHVPAYLLGIEPLPTEMPAYISMGGKEEAVDYVVGNRRVWLNTPGAITWLRAALDVPGARESRSRRLSWGERKMALLRLPLERGETWQVGAIQVLPDRDEEPGWVVVAVGRIGQELLGMEACNPEPKPADLWEFLLDVMTRPENTAPRRPARIEVRSAEFQKAWKAKLKQIGVECAVVETLAAVDLLRDTMPKIAAAATSQAVPATPEELLALPQESDDVWQAEVRKAPAWVTGEGQPYRPWMGMVISDARDLVLAHHITADRPASGWISDIVAQAMRRPLAGTPHRPGAVQVGSAELLNVLRPYLEPAGVQCVLVERLEHLDFVVGEMTNHMAGPEETSSLVDVPGMELEQVRSFYEAAADYYRKKPWQKTPGDTIIQVECERFQGGPWYAVVMGQSGMQQGLAVYEDLAALKAMMTGHASEEENVRQMSAMSLMFSEAFDVPIRDLDAAEKHGWAVAGPEAYPLVLRIDPGMAVRAPFAWELQLLEGCLRTIPAFVSDKAAAAETTVSTADGDLTLRLGWSR
jgi:tetratricopeptide (TPR) repeat protein